MLSETTCCFAVCAVLFQLANASMLPLAGGVLAYDGKALIIVPQLIVALLAPWVGQRAEEFGRKPLLLVGFAALPIRAVLDHGEAYERSDGCCVTIRVKRRLSSDPRGRLLDNPLFRVLRSIELNGPLMFIDGAIRGAAPTVLEWHSGPLVHFRRLFVGARFRSR